MRRAIALLGLALLVSGCLASSPTATLAGTDTAPALASAVVSVVDPEGGMGEPSLGVMPDGTLFTTGLAHTPRDPGAVFRSRDGGATWESVGSPTAPFPNFDPDLAVDADGTVWFDTLWIGCSSVAVSRDGGDSWSASPLACTPPAGDRQYVIPTTGGTAYIYSHHLPTLFQAVSKTTDYGRTWVPVGPAEGLRVPVANGFSGWGGGGFWNPVSGSVFVTFTWTDSLTEGGWSPAFGVTRDGGATWELVRVDHAGGGRVGLSLVVGAADAAGNVYLAWAEAYEDAMAVYMASSTDEGATWSAPKRVTATDDAVVFPAIAAGPSGEVAIAYYQADRPGYPSSVEDDTTWNVTLAWTDDALAETPTFAHARLNDVPVRVGPICPDGTTCEGNRQFLDYFSLERLPDGRVGAVFTSTEHVAGKTVNVYAATEDALLAE